MFQGHTKIALISSFQTESELQELIREVEENPAPPDAPQPPTPKTGDTEGGKEITGLSLQLHAKQPTISNKITIFPRIIARGNYLREGDYFKYCSLEAVP